VAGIQTDIRTVHSHSKNVQALKVLIDTKVSDILRSVRGLFIDRMKLQKMKRYISQIQKYEDRYENSANRAVQFLLFIKICSGPQIKDAPNLPQHLLLTLSEGFNMEDVSHLLNTK
jgi:hypothetical protein